MKLTSLLLLSFICISAMADEIQNQLVIYSKDGSIVAYILNEKPKVTFTESDMIVSSYGVEIKYSLDNVSRFCYESIDITGVQDILTNRPIQIYNNLLCFPFLKQNSIIKIFSVTGELKISKTVRFEGNYSLDISSLTSGAYLVNVNGKTYKIAKK